jgi:chromosome segregation protein
MTSRLKSLELHGYKTFASKVNFEFPGIITAVVGPNGSGKSNIADAIRWVLGEQSYRLLRGRRTEDMIFAGSEGRSRAGMASATITFNNEDSWLPIDYSEVTVTRRAYRDGQNEYLLNGQRIRLKDIQELLAQSGLAERTYTLIGQGLVDSALSIRPDERRKFFEEAAGIGLYRSRREESLNRLDQTRHNLERVTDILSELTPRLRSLERQSRRFLEYKTLQADLQALLRIWYGFHWNNAQKELTSTKQVLRDREKHLENAKTEYKKLDLEFSKAREHISLKREEINKWHAESSAYHLELEKIIRDLAVLEERQRSLMDQEHHQNYDSIRLDEEIKSKEINLNSLKLDLEKLSDEVSETKTNLKYSHEKLNKRTSERIEIENKLHAMRRKLVDDETKLLQAKAKLNELNERIKNFSTSKDKLQNEKNDFQTEFTEKQKNFEESKKQLEQLEKTKAEVLQKRENIRSNKKEIDDFIRQLNNQLRENQTEEIKLRAQLSAIEEAENNLRGYNVGAKNLVKAIRNGKFSSSMVALNEVLEVPREYEVPISAALGEFLDSILIQSKSSPEEAIQFLSSGDQGRAVLLPIDYVKEPLVENHEKIQGLVGRASELIRIEEKFKSAINCLLANTYIIDNQENALKAVKKLPSTTKIVTLTGEVFHGNGVIVAGKENRSSLISRPRVKQEVVDLLKERETKTNEIKRQINSYEKDLLSVTEKEEKLQAEEKDIEKSLIHQNKLMNQLNLDVEKLKQRKSWLENQIVALEKQIEESNQSISATKSSIDNLEKDIAEQRKESASYREQLNQLPIDELQSEVGHWRTNLAVVERALGEAQKRFDENKTTIDQNKQRYQSLIRRLEDFKNNLLEIDDEKATKRAQEQELQAEIEKVREKIIPADEELKEIESKYEKLQLDLSVIQQSVTNAERYVTQGQLDYSRNKDVLDNLRRRIEEDFGLVSFEYSTSISGPTPLPFEGLVEELPVVDEIEPTLEENINRQRAQMRRIGPINPEAEEEYISVKERHEFLTTQVDDLKKADEDLRKVIAELDELMQREFRKTFDAVALEFKELFTRLFGGGSAKLYLTDEENFNNTGIEIEARLPGRREQGLSLLSGGERSLTAVALIFSLLKVSPTPFCVLDEVDAALDESNVGRFCDLLRELSEKIQFIVITHNRNTVQAADVIYGITMGRDSASKMISLKLDEISEDMVK